MGKITLSLSDEAEEELRKLAEKEKRSITKEVEYLIRGFAMARVNFATTIF